MATGHKRKKKGPAFINRQGRLDDFSRTCGGSHVFGIKIETDFDTTKQERKSQAT
jgi:hypothetical protein